VPDNTLPSSDVVSDTELAGRLAAGIVLGHLLGNGKGLRDTSIIELTNMLCNASSRCLREALP
jgi:hypothetical protein